MSAEDSPSARAQQRASEAASVLETVVLWPNGRKTGALRLYLDLLRRSQTIGPNLTVSQAHLVDTAGFGFSDRNGAEMNRQAVRNALDELAAMGLISWETLPADPDELWKGRTFVRLSAPTPAGVLARCVADDSYLLLLHDVDAHVGVNCDTIFGVLQHVVWEERVGLGINAMRVWISLRIHGAASARVLAERLHVNRSTVHRRLTAMQPYGLAEQCDDGWRGCIRDLDVVAEDLGLTDRKIRRTATREHATRGWRGWLAAHDKATPSVGDPEPSATGMASRVGPADCPLLARESASAGVVVLQLPRKRLRATEGATARAPVLLLSA